MKTKIEITPVGYRALSDEELLRRCKELNEYVAVNYIFERYGHIVYGICLKYTDNTETARKQMEHIFIKLAADFRPSSLAFKPWLHQYVHNQCMHSSFAGIANAQVSVKTEHKENIGDNLKIGDIEAALGAVTPEQKACIELFYLKDKTYAEVAAETGIPIARVKDLLYTGKQDIEQNLGMYN